MTGGVSTGAGVSAGDGACSDGRGEARSGRSADFLSALENGFVFFDGSMGALLQSTPTKTKWKAPEQLLVTEPSVIRTIHERYLEAGATVILTNTFGGTQCKLSENGLDAEDIAERAVRVAREARDSRPEWAQRFVAYDIGPTGKLLEPMGTLTFDEAYADFAKIAKAAERAGADLVVVETMSDLYELKAAVLAVRENTNLPVIASATFQDTNRTLTGADAATVVATMEGLGACAVGFNCGSDLAHARTLAADFLACASIPVFMEPNAGIPVIENGLTVFKVAPEEFAETLAHCAALGVRALGGCCGTTPAHIAAAVTACLQGTAFPQGTPLKPLPIVPKNTTVITSWCRSLEFGRGPLVIGERINPTGKKRFKEALLANDMEYVLGEAKAQLDAGAHVLDVNVGLPGIDEAAVMTQAVRAIQRTFPAPLQIDSSEPSVLERALRYYNGKALVNSVNGKKAVMDAVFPIVKKYGGVVVALALDENGIPPTAEGRLAVAEKIVKTAESYGIARKNILVDTLTLTVSSQQKEALETVRAIPLVKAALGVKTVLGVSNISFGLPQRELVNSVFFGLALGAGLDACIINPLSAAMMGVYHSFRALSALDDNCLGYIGRYSADGTNVFASAGATTAGATAGKGATGVTQGARDSAYADDDLRSIIMNGLRDRSRDAAIKLLETKTPVEIIDGYIVPALDEVGKDFEAGRKYLPQLLLSADTVSRAFEVIRERLERSGEMTESKGTILIATVYGDIHDIGKNIVKAMLENYGYTVIDLGKDVAPETIVEAARREKPGIIGLSALMTTTVSNMEKTIALVRESGLPVRIMVGGAVLTAEYAKRIGADYYGKDAMASVNIAKEIFGK